MKEEEQQQNTEKHTRLISFVIFLLVIIGIITTSITSRNTENYFHPYLFRFIFGGIGLIIGLLIALKIKPYIAYSKRLRSQYIYISVFFVGIFMLIASVVNSKVSKIENEDYYLVTSKYRRESRFRSPEVNAIIVEINGVSQKLNCSYSYWVVTTIGQKIDLTIYKSKLGFDYIEITKDK